MRSLPTILLSLLMAACSEKKAAQAPSDPVSAQTVVFRADLDSMIALRHLSDSIRNSEVLMNCCRCDEMVKKEDEILPDTCYFKFNANEQSVFIASDTTELVDEPGMNIMCINDAIVINGRTIYTFRDVLFFEELFALRKWNNYYVYGFISTTDDHGPYVYQSPNGVLIKIDFQKKITIMEDVKFLESFDICTYLDSIDRK